MSDHAWAQEQIAAHVAGGLDAQEAERLEAHARECPECATALNDARTLDRGLESLFAPMKPTAALEDRMVRSLHVIKAADLSRRRWKRTLIWAVAASVGIGTLGAGVSILTRDHDLLFPGDERWTTRSSEKSQDRTIAQNGAENVRNIMSLGYATSDSTDSMTPRAAGGEGRHAGIIQHARGDDRLRNERSKSSGSMGLGDAKVEKSPTTQGMIDSAKASDQAKHVAEDWDRLPAKDRAAQIEFGFVPNEYKWKAANGDPKFAVTNNPDSGLDPNAPPKNKKDRIQEAQVRDPEKPSAAPSTDAAAAQRKIIRSGDIEFEIESFDSAQASVIKIVGAIKGGFIGTVNSEKLANGKVKGSIVVRVPPEALHTFVLDLRRELGKGGELKGQRIGSQDITKQYTDLESRLKAAKTMQDRLLQMIKDGKGEIKQLLEAEKELGVWRTKIEEMEGERRYFDNQVALSTLTITLAEKEIKAAAGLTENEQVKTGIEVEDVEKAQQQLLAAVAEAKGRVTKAEMKQVGAGQFNATVNFEVAPEQSGTLRDRLRQLGLTARLDIERIQQAEGGTPQKDAKVKRGETQFFVQLYNAFQMTPRETATLTLASTDVATAYRTLHDSVLRAKGRVLKASLDEHDRLNVTGELDFDVRRADEATILTALAAAGEVTTRSVSRASEDENSTDTKVRFRTSFVSADRLAPREKTTLTIEVADVSQSAAVFATQVTEAKGRVVKSDVSHERSGRASAQLTYDVPLAAAASLAERFKAAGTVRVQQTARDAQAPDGKFALARLDVTLSNTDLLVPRDDGVWPQVRKGLSWSANVLLLSVSWLIVGLCVVLPWGLAGYGVYRIVRRLSRPSAAPSSPAQASGVA